jgi:hypothetical protein
VRRCRDSYSAKAKAFSVATSGLSCFLGIRLLPSCKPVGHNALNVDLFRGMTTHANSNRWRYQHRRCCDRGVAISGPAAVIQLSSNRTCARQINGRAMLMQRIKFSGGCLFTVFKFRCRV